MKQSSWYRRILLDDWHIVVYYLILVATVIISVVHYLFPTWGGEIAKIAPIIILVFVATIATRLEATRTKLDTKFEALESKLITEERLTAVTSELVEPLGNVRFYPSEDETFMRLAAMTGRAKKGIKATRFSPSDITQATEGYWEEVKRKAYDPNVHSIRIHSLAHPTQGPVENLCKLVEELKDARKFQLGIVFFENQFEVVISDNKECIVGFRESGQMVGSGLHFDSTLPKGEEIVANFRETFKDMLMRCHVLIDFDEWVSTEDDIERLKEFIHRAHKRYLAGTEPKENGDDSEFIREEVFGKQPRRVF